MTKALGSAMILGMRTLGGILSVLVFGLGCSRSGGDAEVPSTTATAASGEAVAPVEAQPNEPQPVAADPDLCVPPSYEQWATCDGKRIAADGRAPRAIAQHPVVSGPDTHQSYLDVDGGAQIIVVSRSPATCDGQMRVVGTLQSIDFGGEPGTKGSYSGWSILDAEVTCR